MRFSKIEVLSVMKETGIVPVFYHKDIAIAKKVLKACYAGGIRAFEFTNRGDFAHEVFGELVKYAAVECPGMIMGIGSIVDAPTASMYIQLGANFIVGPLSILMWPKSPTEDWFLYARVADQSRVGFAQEMGCDLCKVFPGDVLGAAFVKG